MNVKELIEQLQQLPQDMEVMFTYNYGDYWRTDVAAPVDTVSITDVMYSEYHQMDKLAADEQERDLDDDLREHMSKLTRAVVILES